MGKPGCTDAIVPVSVIAISWNTILAKLIPNQEEVEKLSKTR
jgi:hypothetical protein